MIASQPEVETAAIGRVWQWLQRLLENSPGRPPANVQISADAVTLRADGGSQTMTEVAALLETLPGRSSAQIDFRLVGAETPEPACIRVVRSREVSPPASRFELSTGDGELPCSVLALAIDELKPLGPRCRFHGQVWASETPDGWEGEVAGQLAELDFGSLISDHFPHHLSGIGRATITSARFRRSRLEECCGVVAAERGTIGRSLLAAAVDRLGLVPGPAPLPPGNRVAYEELAMSIVLHANGLRLRGLCGTAEPGTILSDGRNRLLGEPPRARSRWQRWCKRSCRRASCKCPPAVKPTGCCVTSRSPTFSAPRRRSRSANRPRASARRVAAVRRGVQCTGSDGAGGVDPPCSVLYPESEATFAGCGSARSAANLRGNHETFIFSPVGLSIERRPVNRCRPFVGRFVAGGFRRVQQQFSADIAAGQSAPPPPPPPTETTVADVAGTSATAEIPIPAWAGQQASEPFPVRQFLESRAGSAEQRRAALSCRIGGDFAQHVRV